MEENITANVAPINCRIFDIENRAIYRIFQETDSSSDLLLSRTLSISNFIDNCEIKCHENYKTHALRVISDGTGFSKNEASLILQFLLDSNYAQIDNNVLKLTSEGQFLRILDRSFVSFSIFEYFWGNADWKSLISSNIEEKLMNKDARALIALSIYAHNEKLYEFAMKNKQIVEDLFINSQFSLEYIFSNKSVELIIKNIFEAMGLLEMNTKNGRINIKTTERGKRIFEYYSRELVEEYNRLTEECWECYDRGNFQQAFEMAAGILAVNQENMEAYNVLGCVYIRQMEYSKARRIFEYAINLYEEIGYNLNSNKNFSYEPYISIKYNLGLCCFYQGDYINSLKILSGIKNRTHYSFESVEDIIVRIKRIIMIDQSKKY